MKRPDPSRSLSSTPTSPRRRLARARKWYPQASALRSAAAALQRMGDPPPLALATPRLRQEAFRHFSEMPAKNDFMTSPQGKHRFRSTTVNNPPRSYSK
jgi:TPR repeat protein